MTLLDLSLNLASALGVQCRYVIYWEIKPIRYTIMPGRMRERKRASLCEGLEPSLNEIASLDWNTNEADWTDMIFL